MIAFVPVLSAVPIGTGTGKNHPGRISFFLRSWFVLVAVFFVSLCCFALWARSVLLFPCAHRLRKIVSPADFFLVLRSWFALALCVLVLCFGFVLISFDICCVCTGTGKVTLPADALLFSCSWFAFAVVSFVSLCSILFRVSSVGHATICVQLCMCVRVCFFVCVCVC